MPDPYYVTSAYDIAVDAKQIQFVNVPLGATIRIYSSSGILLRVLKNNSTNFSGIVIWDVRNRTNQYVVERRVLLQCGSRWGESHRPHDDRQLRQHGAVTVQRSTPGPVAFAGGRAKGDNTR